MAEKKITEFTIDELILKTYKDIANWHNEDATGAGLKLLTFDIINEVTGAVFKHLDIPYNGEIKLDKETKKIAAEAMVNANKK
jgi:hypothetical protein